MKDRYDIFIFAGEPSADLHGEKIIESLLQKNPSLKILAIAGPKMRKLNIDCLMPMEKFQVMGFIDVFIHLPRLIYQFFQLRSAILKIRPSIVLFIDYPDFNLRMAKALKKQHFKGKLCQYVCPSVWAWRRNRIKIMVKNLDFLFCILPFEPTYFTESSLKTFYVGHPLIKRIEQFNKKEDSSSELMIALFPGSRKKEIERNFPLYLKVAQKLLDHYPQLSFQISIAHPLLLPTLQKIMKISGVEKDPRFILVEPKKTYDLMKSCSLAVAKSGTVTLELALHLTPTIVTYGLSSIDLWIAKNLFQIRLPYYSLPNIIAKKEIFPEFIGPFFKEENVYEALKHLLLDKKARKESIRQCEKLREILQEKDSSEEVAKTLIQLLA